MHTKARTKENQKGLKQKSTVRYLKCLLGIISSDSKRTITSTEHEVNESKFFNKSKGRNKSKPAKEEFYYTATRVTRLTGYSRQKVRMYITIRASKPQLFGKIVKHGKDKYRIDGYGHYYGDVSTIT